MVAAAPSGWMGLAMTAAWARRIVDRLAELLRDVDGKAGDAFSGVGVIVAPAYVRLPMLPLRATSAPDHDVPAADFLALISRPEHDLHDGFHLLDPNLRVELVAQYFSPPIVHGAAIDRGKRFGGRYVAALFGSAIPGVVATGVASRDFGLAVFQDGVERLHLPPGALH